jgi:Na+/melibiose symporter-like transporter
MGGGMLMLVLFMVNVLGYSALWAAIGMIPMAAVAFVLSPFTGRLVDLLGPRQLAAAGAVLFSLAFLLFAQLDEQSTLWSIAWREAILGIAMSLSMPTLTVAGLTSLPQRSSGVGSGTISTARAFGSALGVALLLAVYETA